MIGHFFFNVRTIFVKGIRSWEWERTSSHMLRCTYKMREQVHLLQGTSKQYMVLSLIFFRISYLQKENSKGCVVGRGTGNGWRVSQKVAFNSWSLPHISHGNISRGYFFVLNIFLRTWKSFETSMQTAFIFFFFFFHFSVPRLVGEGWGNAKSCVKALPREKASLTACAPAPQDQRRRRAVS